MATLAQSMGASPPARWLREFLQEELAPYPGRMATVGRMVLAATLVMLICENFRIPFAFLGALYTLLISRESPRASVRSAGTILLAAGVGAAYLLIGAWFVISTPCLHFLWNISTFFLAFYVIDTLTNYIASLIFAVIMVIGIPVWDGLVPAETNVELTLWILLAAATGVAVSVVIELVFARTRPGNEIVLPVAERLAAVRGVLVSSAEDRAPDRAAKGDIVRMRTLGTSRLRRLLQRSAYSAPYREQMSGVVALTGRLVDLTVTLTDTPWHAFRAIETRARNLAAAVENIRDDLTHQRIPEPVRFETGGDHSAAASLLGEMEDTVALISQVLAGSRAIIENQVSADEQPPPKLFARDALSNPSHYKFALRGCLAAGGAYIMYHAVDWPNLGITAVTTCLLTALSTIGASRQKQLLRFLGFLIGGVLGMGAQIFALPSFDITGFALMFASVTFLAAWIMTSSPRLSYLGLQMALAFYLIHLQEFAAQLSLSVARDRLAGILLGLLLMWLVFDHLWAAPAAVEMQAELLSAIRLLARFTRQPESGDIPAAIKRSYVLGEKLNRESDKMRSLADGALFEFGPSRPQALALRDRIRRWQPQFRALFLMRRASLKYALRLPGFELPEAGLIALREYNERSARMLDEMANRLEGREPERTPEPEGGGQSLEHVLAACGCEAREPSPAMRAFVILLRRIDGVTSSLAEEVRAM